MQISVYISATLRTFVNRKAKIELDGTTVREILERLQDEYADYTSATFNVISAYAQETGITAADIVESTNTETEAVAVISEATEETNETVSETKAADTAQNDVKADNVNSGDNSNDNAGTSNIGKIITAVVGVIVVIAIIIFLVNGKKDKSSDKK